ncbi:uncharacterized protein LOC119557437 isoform X2 [Drosophila subpulchrella]|uniref:uncharacterized protein LOC119557437 isoform X2 n=1 Tax=Drosophila subpulchrella TaxID=1486046 RepID=UPI0018A186B8|nr:uncharacterized protein LOC119557437 isoform X2 [Drosophila subpulchrella]
MESVYKTLRNREVPFSPGRTARYRPRATNGRSSRRVQPAGTNSEQANFGVNDVPIAIGNDAANLQLQPPIVAPEIQGLDYQDYGEEFGGLCGNTGLNA